MKRFALFVAVFCLLCSAAEAQQYEVFGGLSLPYISYPDAPRQVKGRSEIVPSFHLGVRTYINFSKNWEHPVLYGIAGLAFSGKGYKLNNQPDWAYLYTDYSQKGYGYGLDVPLHLGFRIKLIEGLAMWIETGPTVSFGLFGKWTRELGYNGKVGTKESGDYYERNSECGFAHLEASLSGSLGVEINGKYFIRGGYDHGLVNQNGYPYQSRSRNILVSFGYSF